VTYVDLHHNNLWDDTLMMSVIPLAKIGLLLDRPQYIAEATYQFLLHIQYLVDTPSGLWYHGWEFDGEGGGHNFAKALWARGNCWITVSIPIFLEMLQLPSTDPTHQFLVSTWKRQVDALVKCQDATGLWHTLLVDPSSYVETSATAGFAAGIYMGLRLGLISSAHYRACADNALNGVLANIAADGEVGNVSFGTGMGKDLQFYKDIPITSMPYGQALAMLALVEWERAEKGQ